MPAPLPKAKQAKIAKLADQGVPQRTIAKETGCAKATVTNVLKRFRTDQDQIKQYTGARSDLLKATQAKALQVVHKLLDHGLEEEINDLTPAQRMDMLRTTALTYCQMYNNGRLEDGQSTANNASLLLVARADAAKVPLDK